MGQRTAGLEAPPNAGRRPHQNARAPDALLLNVYKPHETDKQLVREERLKTRCYFGCNDCASSDAKGPEADADGLRRGPGLAATIGLHSYETNDATGGVPAASGKLS